MRPTVLAFSGLQGSGKTTCAAVASELLIEKGYKPVIVKFAAPIYGIMNAICEQTHLDFNKNKMRPVMQYLGGYFRDAYNEDFWVNLWEMEVKSLKMFNENNNLVFIADDLRYDNEAKKVIELGGKVINVESNNRADRIALVGTDHASEAGLSQSVINSYVYNNGAKDELRLNLDYLLSLYSL